MKRAFVLLSSLVLGATLLAATPSKLQVSDAWVRESNPAVKITAGFLTVTNPTDKAITLTGVTSPAAKVVEMHEMKTVDGVMSMRQVPSITVPAKSTVKLAPGGMHLMLIDLGTRLEAGATVGLTLKTDEGAEIALTVPVKKPDTAAHAH